MAAESKYKKNSFSSFLSVNISNDKSLEVVKKLSRLFKDSYGFEFFFTLRRISKKNKLPLFTSTSQKNIAGLILTANRRSMNSLMFCDLVHLKLNEQLFNKLTFFLNINFST